MSKNQQRPASRADIPARIEKELDTVRHLIDVLTHEFTTIAIDEFIDLQTRRTLLNGARMTSRIRRRLFGDTPSGRIGVTVKKASRDTVIKIMVSR